ncbi:unnamed protein product [Rhizophagus irregularis]|nr:unnamed protein product [Rhizophagus irregularis]
MPKNLTQIGQKLLQFFIKPMCIYGNFAFQYLKQNNPQGHYVTTGAVGVPDHWWSPIDDVAEAKVKWNYLFSLE